MPKDLSVQGVCARDQRRGSRRKWRLWLLAALLWARPAYPGTNQPVVVLPLAPPYLDAVYSGFLLGRPVGSSIETSITTGTFGNLAPFVVRQGQVTIVQPASVPETELAGGGGMQVSRDGTTVVGFLRPSEDYPSYHAFRSRNNGAPVDLGTLGPTGDQTFYSVATDVSANGSVVVGYSLAPAGPAGAKEHAFRWTEGGGLVDLGSAVGANGFSRALGMSADGSVTVGVSEFPGGARHAFRHTDAAGFQDLGAFDGLFFNSVATAVTADGRVVVGQSDSAGRSRAFRWSEDTGLQDLGVLPGDNESGATGISDDGRIVVGISSREPLSNDQGVLSYFLFHTDDRAFQWTSAKGMEDLNQFVIGSGGENSEFALVAANGISPDGQWIAGAIRITQSAGPDTVTAVILQLGDGSQSGPTLVAKRVGQSLEITWSGADFVLEQSTRLGKEEWTRVAGPGVVSATIPLNGIGVFLRLRR